MRQPPHKALTDSLPSKRDLPTCTSPRRRCSRPGAQVHRVREHIESRLHLVPRFRQKVAPVPFPWGRPIWVDDPHYIATTFATPPPAPGREGSSETSRRDLLATARPLEAPLGALGWVEGLKGDRFAIVAKTHHC